MLKSPRQGHPPSNESGEACSTIMKTKSQYEGYYLYHLINDSSELTSSHSDSGDVGESPDVTPSDDPHVTGICIQEIDKNFDEESRDIQPVLGSSDEFHFLKSEVATLSPNDLTKSYSPRDPDLLNDTTSPLSQHSGYSRETIVIYQGASGKELPITSPLRDEHPSTQDFLEDSIKHSEDTGEDLNVRQALSSETSSEASLETWKDKVPNAVCRWGGKSGKPLKCYVQFPNRDTKKDLSNALALWILDRLSEKESTYAELSWVRRVQSVRGTDQVELDLDDHTDVLNIQFHDMETKALFEKFAEKTACMVRMTDQYPLLKNTSLTTTYTNNPPRVHLHDKFQNITASYPLSQKNTRDAQIPLDSLRNNPIKRLPSMTSDFSDHVNKLIDFIQEKTPEAYWLARQAQFCIAPFGTSQSDVSKMINVRLLLSPNAGASLEIHESCRKKIPEKMKRMLSFNEVFHVIDVSAVLRFVPIDTHTFILTLKYDEQFRLLITKFKSLLQRWAVGDVFDSISHYGSYCNYKCSLTSRQVLLLNLMQTYLSILPDSQENSDEFHLEKDPDSTMSSNPLSVVIKNNVLVWKEDNPLNLRLDPSAFALESFERVDECYVDLHLRNLPEPLRLAFNRPKLQCYFGEYLKGVERRQAYFEYFPSNTEFEQSMSKMCCDAPTQYTPRLYTKQYKFNIRVWCFCIVEDASALISYLLEVCREPCLTLARLNIQVQSPDSPTRIPSHFNLICTRIVPDAYSTHLFSSIDLRRVVRDETLPNAQESISVETDVDEDGKMQTETYILHFQSLVDLYSFKRFCRQISVFQQKECDFVVHKLHGNLITKPGVRVNNLNKL